MKTLIVYASKNGASAEACEMLRERLSSFSEVDLCDVRSDPPSPDGYDVLVVGGSIRMNKLSRALKKYISANVKTISSMPSATSSSSRSSLTFKVRYPDRISGA